MPNCHTCTPTLAIVASGRHIFDKVKSPGNTALSAVYNHLLLIDLPTASMSGCAFIFTLVVAANFVVQIRLRTAIKKARSNRQRADELFKQV